MTSLEKYFLELPKKYGCFHQTKFSDYIEMRFVTHSNFGIARYDRSKNYMVLAGNIKWDPSYHVLTDIQDKLVVIDEDQNILHSWNDYPRYEECDIPKFEVQLNKIIKRYKEILTQIKMLEINEDFE